MKKLSLLSALICFLTAITARAQDFDFGKPSTADLSNRRYEQDTTANAVVLREFGTASISSNDGTPLLFEYHVQIKIFNAKGFSQGDIVIPTYFSDNNSLETVSDIEAKTFSLDKTGNVIETPLDPKKIYNEKKNKRWNLIKFALPNLADGCIIEYKYKLQSPFIFNFRHWEFQSDIPKIYSEYLVYIPSIYNYNVSLIGAQKITETKADIVRECFTPGGGFKADCSKMTYIMKDVPALVEEDYMTAPANFRSAINFELSDYVDYYGVKHKVTKEWSDIDNDLKKSDDFGLQLKKKGLFTEQLAPIIAKTSDDLSKAKAIYTYIQSQFRCNGFRGIYSDNLRKAFDQHTGSIADINLSLVSALSGAGLSTEAVLISTRENGFVNKLYPVVSNFDYVIAKVNIGEKSYLLDASEPLLGFGLIPIRCVNDQGRVVSLDKPSYWIDLVASEKESTLTSFNLVLKDDGKITGTLTRYFRGYDAFEQRKAIKKFNSVDEYVENLDEGMPKIKILKSGITNLDSLDQTLCEIYTIEINAYDNLSKERISFSPFLLGASTENPFKLESRTYPVDWGAPSIENLTVVLAFPEKLEVISKPAEVGWAMPGGAGRYIVHLEQEGNVLTFAQSRQLNKSIYSTGEYPYLKELFNKIIATQRSEIIFKQKP